MLKWMCGKIKMDKVRNKDILSLVGVASIENKMRKNRLRWFGHIGLKRMDASVRRVEKIDIKKDKKFRGKPKMTWMDVVKKDMKLLELEERMVADRNVWKRRICVLDRIKLFICLDLYSRFHIIEIKANWFGLLTRLQLVFLFSKAKWVF